MNEDELIDNFFFCQRVSFIVWELLITLQRKSFCQLLGVVYSPSKFCDPGCSWILKCHRVADSATSGYMPTSILCSENTRLTPEDGVILYRDQVCRGWCLGRQCWRVPKSETQESTSERVSATCRIRQNYFSQKSRVSMWLSLKNEVILLDLHTRKDQTF